MPRSSHSMPLTLRLNFLFPRRSKLITLMLRSNTRLSLMLSSTRLLTTSATACSPSPTSSSIPRLRLLEITQSPLSLLTPLSLLKSEPLLDPSLPRREEMRRSLMFIRTMTLSLKSNTSSEKRRTFLRILSSLLSSLLFPESSHSSSLLFSQQRETLRTSDLSAQLSSSDQLLPLGSSSLLSGLDY